MRKIIWTESGRLTVSLALVLILCNKNAPRRRGAGNNRFPLIKDAVSYLARVSVARIRAPSFCTVNWIRKFRLRKPWRISQTVQEQHDVRCCAPARRCAIITRSDRPIINWITGTVRLIIALSHSARYYLARDYFRAKYSSLLLRATFAYHNPDNAITFTHADGVYVNYFCGEICELFRSDVYRSSPSILCAIVYASKHVNAGSRIVRNVLAGDTAKNFAA